MTTIPINLYQLLAEAIDDDYLLVPAKIQVSELLEYSDIDPVNIDIHWLLHQQQSIAHIWTIKDVQSVRPDLNANQAWQVLLSVEQSLDSNLGITWAKLEQTASMFGQPHENRPKRLEQALSTYNGLELTDMLADALHWCQAHGTSFDDALRLARLHFDAETDSE